MHLLCCCVEQSIFDEAGNEQQVPCSLDATGDDGLCDPCREGCTLLSIVYTANPGTVAHRHIAISDAPKSTEDVARLAEERRDR